MRRPRISVAEDFCRQAVSRPYPKFRGQPEESANVCAPCVPRPETPAPAMHHDQLGGAYGTHDGANPGLATPSAAFQSCLSICLSTVPAEQLVHDDRTGLNHRPQLVPVHQFGDRCAAVSDQLRDLLERHACIGKWRDKRVS
jgi:hypothetical protein